MHKAILYVYLIAVHVWLQVFTYFEEVMYWKINKDMKWLQSNSGRYSHMCHCHHCMVST